MKRFPKQRTRNDNAAEPRRGNTIVLVIGVLVLFVIIATAYVSRTQAGRGTADSVRRQSQRDDNLNVIANDLATEISQSLFVRPIDSCVSPGWAEAVSGEIVSANRPRLPAVADALRYGTDFQFDPCATGDKAFPYNTAPYEVVPRTNWPDSFGGPDPLWPGGYGNFNGGAGSPALNGEDNPLGMPGFGDTRWLRDLEPLRWDTDGDLILDAFSHWRHLTNLSRPDNGLRVVFDISDIGDSNGDLFYGRLVTDLNVPWEQFLTLRHDYLNPVTGDTDLSLLGVGAFVDNWGIWLLSVDGYKSAYTASASIPPNYLRLSDLDADGIRHEAGERPSDEFIGPGMVDSQNVVWPTGTPRWNVSRILTDTDGDGYTDALWHLLPTSIHSGIRQIVAVSIIDNASMLNANVATRFMRHDPATGAVAKTTGLTPADLALVGQLFDTIESSNYNVGFYDNPDHDTLGAQGVQPFDYDVTMGTGNPNPWQRHLVELGLATLTQMPTTPQQAFPAEFQRLDYWRRAASNPFSVETSSPYTPFTLADEIELRMYFGQNYPWIFSRYEHSVQDLLAPNNLVFLRAGIGYEEASEFLGQTTNRGAVLDPRHRVTLFNGTRNDIAPPWTWLFMPGEDVDEAGPLLPNDFNGNGVVDGIDAQIGTLGMRKFDLRLGPIETIVAPTLDLTDHNRLSQIFNVDYTANVIEYNFRVGTALRNRLEMALMDRPAAGFNIGTYFGVDPADEALTRKMAAAFAANIMQWRDREVDPVSNMPIPQVSVDECIPVTPAAGAPPGFATSAFMGMEAQPFLLEVFIGHVYFATTVPANDGVENGEDPYLDQGDYLLLDSPGVDPARRRTVVAVQIANPFDVPIDLSQYRITVAGQHFELATAHVRDDLTGLGTPAPMILQPATAEKPTTAIYYSIDPVLIGNNVADLKWKKFLDLVPRDHPSDTIIATSHPALPPSWDWDREAYDDGPCEVELSRRDPASDPANPVWVVVDRMDRDPDAPDAFAKRVEEMGQPGNRPHPEPSLLPDVPPGGDNWYHPDGHPIEEIKLGPQGLGYSQWVQWVRATRAWGIDLNESGWYDPNERSPRYVFSQRAVIYTPGGPPVGLSPATDGTTSMGPGRGGNRYKFDRDPDADPSSLPAPNLPWFTRKYYRADGVLVPEPAPVLGPNQSPPPRKPTFFEMNGSQDPAAGNCVHPHYPFGFSYPDKGWYGQIGAALGGANDERAGSVDEQPAFFTTINPPQQRNSHLTFPMQMLQKDGDFEQVGELLNVWLFGHELEFSGAGTFTGRTIQTFSEYMTDQVLQADVRVNRLRTAPLTIGSDEYSAVIGVGDITNLSDPRHSVPALPAGARVFDAFVCDGPGVNIIDANGNGFPDPVEVEVQRLLNAKQFDGSATPGMINIATAPPEVMRSLPHWYRLVHESGMTYGIPATTCPATPPAQMFNNAGQPLVTDGSNPDALLPRTMIAEAIMHYREGFNGGYDVNGAPLPGPAHTGIFNGSSYELRRQRYSTAADWTKWVRGERGFASIGEVLNVTNPGQNATGYVDYVTAGPPMDRVYNQYWSVDMGVEPQFNDPAPAKPFWGIDPVTNEPYQESMRISTDRSVSYDPFPPNATPPNIRADNVAGDVEEANALFAGASNIITTRSDVFTVYFRVRSFRQNTSVNPPKWDATDPEYIVDDSRYVMLVDRSNVNKPGDKPRILYLEKLPN